MNENGMKVIWKQRQHYITELVAKQLHNEYERIAKNECWKTQENCRVSFNDLPKENKEVMIKLAEFVMKLRKKKDYEIILESLKESEE